MCLCWARSDFLIEVSQELHQYLRPLIIRQYSVDLVCSAIRVVRAEILPNCGPNKGRAPEAFGVAIGYILTDMQEVCARVFVCLCVCVRVCACVCVRVRVRARA